MSEKTFGELLNEAGELPCHSAPELFFDDDRDRRDPLRNADKSRMAKRLCNDCQIRRECLSYAMENNIAHGVWGQTTPLERRMIRLA